jgi:hypothetical protein
MGFEKTEYHKDEQLRMIPGYEGIYAISNYGKVQRLAAGNQTYIGKVLKPIINKKTGYPYVKLCNKGKALKAQLHILVANLFLLPPTNSAFIVNHKDGNKLNPVYTNLEWISRSDNAKHAIKTGLQKLCFGEKNGATRLKFDDVKAIREAFASGKVSQKELSEKYGISVVYVSNLVNKKYRAER